MPATALMAERARFAEIDALKAAGIATVVLIHCVRSDLDPSASPLEVWIGHATRFGVPAFLFASGFLYADPAAPPAGAVARRLRRILVPYLLASLAALLWPFHSRAPADDHGPLFELAFGAAFGPYYYVFVIAGLVVVTPLVARLPRGALLAATGSLVAAQWWVDAWGGLRLPLFWHIRNPLLWWGYFFAGFALRGAWPRASALVRAQRRPLAAWLAAAAGVLLLAMAVSTSGAVVRSAAWLGVWTALALIAVASSGSRGAPWLRYLSDATYAVYLLHLFFVHAVASLFEPTPLRADPVAIAATFAAGLLGPLLLVAALKRVLGARSRDWIGA